MEKLRGILKRISEIRWRAGIPILFICLLMVIMTVLNLDLTKDAFTSFQHISDFSLRQFATGVADNLMSDGLFAKESFINLNGLFMRLTGRKTVNGVSKLKNGMLTEYEDSYDYSSYADQLAYLSQVYAGFDVSLLYVQAPIKVPLDDSLLPKSDTDFSNANADKLLERMENLGVSYLDLRPLVSATKTDVNNNFYRTDHHWMPNASLSIMPELLEKIGAMTGTMIDDSLLNPDLWFTTTYKDNFLGSWGQRAGTFFAGMDDTVVMTPKFETNLSRLCAYNDTALYGTFAETTIRTDLMDYKSPYKRGNYAVYYGGDYPIVKLHNPDAPNKLRVVFLKDSFGNLISPYLNTVFTEVIVIDPRYYENFIETLSISDYALSLDPDIVIVEAYPGTLDNNKYAFAEGIPTAMINASQPNGTREIMFIEMAEVAMNYSNNNCFTVPVQFESGHYYRITCDSIDALIGSVPAVTVALSDPTTGEIVRKEIWDLQNGSENELTWLVDCPPGYENAPLMLRVYTGVLYGEVAGNSIRVNGLRVTDILPQYGAHSILTADSIAFAEYEGRYTCDLPTWLVNGKTYLVQIGSIDTGDTVGEKLTIMCGTQNGTHNWISQEFDLVRDINSDGSLQWLFTVPQEGKWYVAFQSDEIVGNGDLPEMLFNVNVLEMTGPIGNALFESEQLSIVPSDSNYNHIDITAQLYPGKTYTLYTGAMTSVSGYSNIASAALVMPSVGTTYATTSWYAGAPHAWTVTVPEYAGICQFILYAGNVGEAAGIGVVYEDVTVTEWPEVGTTGIYLSDYDTSIYASENEYNHVELPCLLRPGSTYQLTINDFHITDGLPTVLSVCLYDRPKNEEIASEDWWIGGTKYTFYWTFKVPETFTSWDDLSLSIYAGQRGSTAGNGIDLSGILLREITP